MFVHKVSKALRRVFPEVKDVFGCHLELENNHIVLVRIQKVLNIRKDISRISGSAEAKRVTQFCSARTVATVQHEGSKALIQRLFQRQKVTGRKEVVVLCRHGIVHTTVHDFIDPSVAVGSETIADTRAAFSLERSTLRIAVNLPSTPDLNSHKTGQRQACQVGGNKDESEPNVLHFCMDWLFEKVM